MGCHILVFGGLLLCVCFLWMLVVVAFCLLAELRVLVCFSCRVLFWVFMMVVLVWMVLG